MLPEGGCFRRNNVGGVYFSCRCVCYFFRALDLINFTSASQHPRVETFR